MRRTVLGLLVLAGAVVAQTRPPGVAISELLMAANDPGQAARLTDQILGIGLRRPAPRPVVEGFVRSLMAGLAGKQLTRSQADDMSRLIVNAAAGTRPNLTNVHDFRIALAKVGVDEARQDQISRRLIAIGEAVRGPDDLPARVPLLQRPRN